MKPKRARAPKVAMLISQLGDAMDEKDYDEVELILGKYPTLIRDLTPKCEVPLVMAILRWNPRLVNICVKHGANPEEPHVCSKDKKPKIPLLIANEEFKRRTNNHKDLDKCWMKNFNIYSAIMTEMYAVTPPKQSGS